jgi:hypothetical protein
VGSASKTGEPDVTDGIFYLGMAIGAAIPTVVAVVVSAMQHRRPGATPGTTDRERVAA